MATDTATIVIERSVKALMAVTDFPEARARGVITWLVTDSKNEPEADGHGR